jgi:hypothetical protein
MCHQQEFLQFADHCKQLLNEHSLPTHRDTLQRMADAWVRLAAEEQRIADLVRDADALFAPAGHADARLARSRSIRARLQ